MILSRSFWAPLDSRTPDLEALSIHLPREILSIPTGLSILYNFKH